MAIPRRNCPNLAKPSCGPTPAVLCKASSNLRVPSGTEPRPGWRWLARLFESQFLYLRTNFRVPTVFVCAPAKSSSNACPAFERFRYLRRGARDFSASHSSSARGDFFTASHRSYFRSPAGISTDFAFAKRLKSLLTRAGCRSALESWSWLDNKLKLPLRRAGGASRHSVLAYRVRKTVSVRALAEIDLTTFGCLVDFLLQQSRAGRAIPTSWNCAQAARAPLTPRRRAHRASYWPFGREKPALSARHHFFALRNSKSGPR